MARRGSAGEGVGVIRITASGTTTKHSRYLKADERRIANILMLAVDEAARTMQKALREEAPERTGRLKRNIKITRFNRNKTRPVATLAVLPPGHSLVGGMSTRKIFDFNYLPVTRFGRKAVESTRHMITMRHAPNVRGVRAQVFRPRRHGMAVRIRSATALRFTPKGTRQALMRRKVGAYRPPGGDWVKHAEQAGRPEVTAIFQAANQAIYEELKSGRSLRSKGFSMQRASRFGRFD